MDLTHDPGDDEQESAEDQERAAAEPSPTAPKSTGRGFGSYAAAMLARDAGQLAAMVTQVQRTVARSLISSESIVLSLASAVGTVKFAAPVFQPPVASLLSTFGVHRVVADWAPGTLIKQFAPTPSWTDVIAQNIGLPLQGLGADLARSSYVNLPFESLGTALFKNLTPTSPPWPAMLGRSLADFARPWSGFVADMAVQALSLQDVLGNAALGFTHAAMRSVRAFARTALDAALQARQAAIHGRTEELDWFIIHWLHRRPSALLRQALAAALLQDQWLPTDPNEFVLGVLCEIELLTEREIRNHKWLRQTQIRGQRIGALDAPLPGLDLRLADILVAPCPADTVDFEDARLDRLLRQLPANERAVVLARGNTETWELAAIEVGQAAAFGERVRRKCKRLAAELARRDGMSRTRRTGLPAARAHLSAS